MTRTVVLTLVLALAGCGATTLSHEQLVSRADSICATIEQPARQLTGDTSDLYLPGSRLRPAAAALTSAVGRLAALRPPRADERRYRAWFADMRRVDRESRRRTAQIVALENEVNRTMPRGNGAYVLKVGRPGTYMARLMRRLDGLTRPLSISLSRAARNAHALGFRTCATVSRR